MSVLVVVGIAFLVALRLITILPGMAAKGEWFPRTWRLWALGEHRNGKTPKSKNVIM
ncbi:MAG TPA: hypothetical protein VHZ74_20190 [Bryobacteraceae bacterium]|jgi:hypothetical protein|nr:hypothetical protein [Bryobacteraceae bacterium]